MTDRSVLVRLRADISDYQRKLAMASATTAGFVKNLDSADSRMSNLVQTSLALAPALVPIGAAAVPAIAGLTMQLGFATAAAGVSVLAFQGIGDSLDALNDYKLEPTAENFAKLEQHMDALGPAGQEFVFFLQSVRPELQKLQNVAQDGLFPGTEEGIEELLELMPLAEQYVGTISSTLGGLMAEAGDNLNDDRWVEFFEYLDREAGPTLTAMGRGFGNVIEGVSNLLMAADPLSDMFTGGLLDASRDFREWTDGLDDSEGFQSFLDYIRDNGPQAMDTLGALGGALVSLVQATAPVGAVALPVIEALAHALSALAESPAGPVLIGAAAGISAISRAIMLYNAAQGSALMGMVSKGGKEGAAAGLGWRAAGVGVGLFAASLTDLDDRAGLANTATGALLGTMIAPGWGTAVGATAGLVMDAAQANDDLGESYARLRAQIRELDAGASTSGLMADLQAQNAELGAFAAEMEEAAQRGGDAWWALTHPGQAAAGAKNVIEGIFGDSDVEELEADSRAASRALLDLQSSMAIAVGGGRDRIDVPLLPDGWAIDVEELDRAVTKALPALTAMGYSGSEIAKMSEMSRTELRALNGEIRAWVDEADSGAGRTEALAGAFADLGNEMIPTASAAESLADALDSILGPELNLSQATDQWREGLRNLNDDLAKHTKTLVGNTDAADQNREAIRDRVGRMQDLLVAEAEAGAGSARLTRMMRAQRGALLAAGDAAGMSRKELNGYLNDLGMTPKMVRTVIDAVTDPAERKRKALMDHLIEVDRYRATPKIDANTGAAMAGISSVRGALNNIPDEDVWVTVRKRGTGLGAVDSAKGNFFPAPVRYAAFGQDVSASYAVGGLALAAGDFSVARGLPVPASPFARTAE